MPILMYERVVAFQINFIPSNSFRDAVIMEFIEFFQRPLQELQLSINGKHTRSINISIPALLI